MATTISQLRPSLEGVDIHRWIVLQKEGLVDIKGEKLQALHVADESASVILCVSAEVAGFLRPGDICELKSGHTEYANGSLYLIAGKSAKVVRQGEFTLLFAEQPNMTAPSAP